jgi:hypothetical protein
MNAPLVEIVLVRCDGLKRKNPARGGAKSEEPSRTGTSTRMIESPQAVLMAIPCLF